MIFMPFPRFVGPICAPPPFAITNVASMKHSASSRAPLSRSSLATSINTRRKTSEDQHRGCLLRLSVSLGNSRRSVRALDFDVAARQTYDESVSAELERSRQNSLHSLACATVAAAIHHSVLLALSRRSIA